VQYPQHGVALVPAQIQSNPPVAPKKCKKKKNSATGQGSAVAANTAIVLQQLVQAAPNVPQGQITNFASSSATAHVPSMVPAVLPVDDGTMAEAAMP
jgi:predicted outer membrane repeat protein